MGQKYRVTGKFPIARLSGPDAMPADPAAGRKEGEVFDADELDPRTLIRPLVAARLIAPVAEPAKPEPSLAKDEE